MTRTAAGAARTGAGHDSPVWPEATRAERTDTGRLRLTHGPIDLILDIAGEAAAVARAETAARRAFDGLLETLVAELPLLRRPVTPASPAPRGPVARRMHRAVRPFADDFITPMAAVAGSVADHILAALPKSGLTRAVINNGGDIALGLFTGPAYRLGIHDGHRGLAGHVRLTPGDGIGGVATSGWRGRSHSLGIADAVTVLAADAAGADAAATMIANAVDLPGCPRIARAPARSLAPDSDLGDRLVTVGVAALAPADRAAALARGAERAALFSRTALIRAAFLCLQGEVRCIGPGPAIEALPQGEDA